MATPAPTFTRSQDAASEERLPEWDRRDTLTAALTSFVGRERELADLAQMFGTCRLLTLTGPGGCGKTHLALELAVLVARSFPDGVRVVSLAALTDPSMVASAIAAELGIRAQPERPPVEGLARFIADRRILLVLDNFEHVVSAGPLLLDLLTACPRLTVLVTSRHVLRLRGEQVYLVPSLTLPIGESLSSGEDVAPIVIQAEAVRLFVDRARSALPSFQLDATNARAVVEICLRVDGLPLALELAAARVRHLTPESLCARLEHRLSLLTVGAHDLPARQRTLRDAIAWSYDLLDSDEQRLFRRLGVFVGGFDLDAVEGIGCQMSGVGGLESSPDTHNPGPEILDLIGSLVEKSLLHPMDDVAGEPRFAMLETIREYALERLDEAGELDAVRHRHRD